MSVDWGWVSHQLSGWRDKDKKIEEATVELLRKFDELREKWALDDDDERIVLSNVQKLALGHAIVMEKPDERWTDVIPGEYGVRDVVRVREDAYAGTHGRRHNGKRGRVAGVHQSKVFVIYDDAKNSEEGFYHEPDHLERLL